MNPQQYLNFIKKEIYDTESVLSTSYQKGKENNCDVCGMYLWYMLHGICLYNSHKWVL